MFQQAIRVCAIALACALCTAARAQSSNDLEDIRNQIRALKDAYESRMEEAFAQTTSLGHGFTFKADTSLVQRAFLGDNYSDDGVQLVWVAPLPVYVELGGELGRGANPPGSNTDKNGIGSSTFFAHIGDDTGTGGSYRFGVSTLRTSTNGSGTSIVDIDDRTGTNSPYVGDTRLYGVDFVYKWAPDGNAKYRNFKLITEWFTTRRDGTLLFNENSAGVPEAAEAFKLHESAA